MFLENLAVGKSFSAERAGKVVGVFGVTERMTVQSSLSRELSEADIATERFLPAVIQLVHLQIWLAIELFVTDVAFEMFGKVHLPMAAVVEFSGKTLVAFCTFVGTKAIFSLWCGQDIRTVTGRMKRKVFHRGRYFFSW